MNVYLDIETIPSQLDWVKEHVTKGVKPPASMKKQETIDKWEAEKKDEAISTALEKTSFDGAMNHIVCISIAIDDAEPISFSNENETLLLKEFYAFLDKATEPYGRVFIGHNITGFDMRIIKQRSIILKVPVAFNMWDVFNAKPWDHSPFDTMIQWDSKSFTKLDTIAKALGIEGKDGMHGGLVYGLWQQGLHKEIAEYCKDDVRLVREVYKHMKIAYNVA